MNELDAILDAAEPDTGARALEVLLRRPLREIRMGEARSPEQDVIAEARRRGMISDRGGALASVARKLLEGIERSIACGDLSESTLGVAGRLGFLCTSLELDVDASHFYKIALTLELMIDSGLEVPLTEYFLVLRSIGRLQRTGASTLGLEVFWANKLNHEAYEIRTLAAQNLVRVADAWRLGNLYAESLFETDVDHQLVAFEWLMRAGSPGALAEDVRGLSPGALGLLARGLEHVGEVDAALAVRSLGAPGRPDVPAASDWLGDLPSSGPVPAHAVSEFPRVISIASHVTVVGARLRSPLRGGLDLEVLRSFMSDADGGTRTKRRHARPRAGLEAQRTNMASR